MEANLMKRTASPSGGSFRMTRSAQLNGHRINADLNRSTCCTVLSESIARTCEVRDSEIFAAARAESITEFDQLQRLYSARLFRTILRITRNREDAEDALQDTLLRAYVSLHRFEGRSSLYSWLTRIAMNSALMILRRRRTRPEIVVISSSEEGPDQLSLEAKDPGINPEQLCDIRQRWNQVLHSIRKLEPRLRAPVEIQLAEDLPLKDIAGALNISIAAAKSRLYRARTRLANRINEQRRYTARSDW
jgi:RNA polymerase sigma-70 factor (ECF subfamily)